ncbi:MAG: hypothetical protein D3908_03285 [Candidatus Electrothrix sp. AUS4]|nr:hypothetical protein [Candidatus Electrothrix sp. AUS4]
MSWEQKWLVAMWAKVYQQYCLPFSAGQPPKWLLSVPDSGGLLPIDQYFIDDPEAASRVADTGQLEGNANFAYATNFIPHFAGQPSDYNMVWDAYEKIFGQIDQRIAKFGLPKNLVGTEEGEIIRRQRQLLLDPQTAPDSKPYRDTMLAVPPSLFDTETPWSKVSVNAKEIDKVLDSAPNFIKRMVGWRESNVNTSPLDNIVDEISFEINTARIVRPWFDLSQLKRPLWTWILPGTPALSDGDDPPQGDLPAIPDKVVFARNAEMKFKASQGGSTSENKKKAADSLRFLPFMKATIEEMPTVPHLRSSPRKAFSVVARPWLLSAQKRKKLLANSILKPAELDALSRSTARRAEFNPILFRAASVGESHAAMHSTVTNETEFPRRHMGLHEISHLSNSITTAVSHHPPETSTEPSPPVPSPLSSGFHEVQILAFLCRSLPKLPNPMPDLIFD